MMIVLSPAKTLDFASTPATRTHSQPAHLVDAQRLIGRLRRLGAVEVATLMSLSNKLAALNVARYTAWGPPFTPDNARQAILAFDGDVYTGLAARTLTEDDFAFAQRHLRILSGLYGVLRPLDLMQPYRLEMGTRLATGRGDDLYAYWGTRIARHLRAAMRDAGADTLVNLASEEYFGAVDIAALKAPIVTPVFEDWHAPSRRYRIISFHAKKARGMMARHAIVNRIIAPEALKACRAGGYVFAPAASSAARWVFRRRVP
ncbi:MAG: peroxide stress protein YaaA [Burkholderiales bacterium]|nr:peroxide stress protein YaaA [Burkholderiales bacterium]